MKEHKIYANDIFDFEKQLNDFFEANPTAEVKYINSPNGILDINGEGINSGKLIAEIIYE